MMLNSMLFYSCHDTMHTVFYELNERACDAPLLLRVAVAMWDIAGCDWLDLPTVERWENLLWCKCNTLTCLTIWAIFV